MRGRPRTIRAYATAAARAGCRSTDRLLPAVHHGLRRAEDCAIPGVSFSSTPSRIQPDRQRDHAPSTRCSIPHATIGPRENAMNIKAVVFDAYGTLYDIQSVAAITEEAFPGYGEIITQIWRIKQLEYTWLRSLMRRYEDFSVSHAGFAGLHAPDASGCEYDDAAFARIMDKYLHLDLYPDATGGALGDEGPQARDSVQRQPRHARRAGAGTAGSTACSTPPSASTRKKIFKPSSGRLQPDRDDARGAARRGAVHLLEPWDACGAKAFGLNVAWIERVTPEAMALACAQERPRRRRSRCSRRSGPRWTNSALEPDYRIHALAELPATGAAHSN